MQKDISFPFSDFNLLSLSSVEVLLLLWGRALGPLQPFYDMRYYSVSSHSLLLKSYIAPHLVVPVSRIRSTDCCLAADFAEGLNLGSKCVETLRVQTTVCLQAVMPVKVYSKSCSWEQASWRSNHFLQHGFHCQTFWVLWLSTMTSTCWACLYQDYISHLLL